LEEVVNDAAGGHETGIYCAADDAPKRIPGGMVEPIPKFLQREDINKFVIQETKGRFRT